MAPHRKTPLSSQSPFWDRVNAIELPLVRLIQNLTFAHSFPNFWERVAKLASATVLSSSPAFLFCLARPAEANRLGTTLVLYALLSSLGKFYIVRRRPGSYDGVTAPFCAPTSSFPSRHTIGTAILADFLPSVLRWPYIVLLVTDRIACGQHFLSDCVVGFGIAKVAIWVAPMVENPNLGTALMVIGLMLWKGGAKILAGALPVLVAPRVTVAKCLVVLTFAKAPVLRIMRRGIKREDPMKILVEELLVVSLLLFIAVKANEFIERYEVKKVFENTALQRIF
jgi:membrane-associated phospholipid phosphatase